MKLFTRSFAVVALATLVVPVGLADDKKAAPTAAAPAQPPAAEVEVIKDVVYVSGTADERQKLDLYLPKGKKDYPIVLFLHGGGFSKGDRKDVAPFGQFLAGKGIGVAAAGYRLFPQSKHPHQVQDAAKALTWLKASAAKHGWRPDRIFVGGHSAGGHLASLLATDEQYVKAEGLTLKDIRGVIALSGAYRVPEQRQDVFGDEVSRKQASPITHVKPGVPAFFLAYAEKDSPGRDQLTKEFAAALQGVRTEFVVFEAKERDHGSLFTAIKAGDPTGEAVIVFVRRLSEGTK